MLRTNAEYCVRDKSKSGHNAELYPVKETSYTEDPETTGDEVA